MQRKTNARTKKEQITAQILTFAKCHIAFFFPSRYMIAISASDHDVGQETIL